MDKIKGGYYIKARKLRNSNIAKKPPHFREIWDWLIEQANYSTNGKVPRGSCIRSIKDIQEGLIWYIGYRKQKYSITQCENAMKWLRNAEMIITMKAEGGTLIKIDNYDLYQDPKNYESRTSTEMKAERKPNESRTTSQDTSNNDSPRAAKEGNESNKEIKDIVAFLNLTTGRYFRYQSEKTQRHIKARLNDGFKLDDFKLVIEDKIKDWKDNKDMKRFLRPETLFGTKMEGYLQEAKDNKKQSDEVIA